MEVRRKKPHFGCGLVAPARLGPTETSMGERPGNAFATGPNARLPQEDEWGFEWRPPAPWPVASALAVCRASDLFTQQERGPVESTWPLPRTRTGDRESEKNAAGFSRSEKSVDIAQRLGGWQKAGDERLFKIIDRSRLCGPSRSFHLAPTA